MDMVILSLPAALIAGLAFGAGPCNVTCLPYLGPVFLKGDGIRQAWRILLPFTLGRLVGYTGLGLVAGMAGEAITGLLHSSMAAWILGIAAITVGLNLFRTSRHSAGCHSPVKKGNGENVRFEHTPHSRQKTVMPGALFMMGTGMALNPCVPLTTILAAAAASGSTVAGLGMGLAFGIGAVVIPAFLFGLLIAHFGSELKQHMGHWGRHIEKVSGSLLVLLGIATISGWVQP